MDKRKSTLGRTVYFHRGLFSKEIQAVLLKRKDLFSHAELSPYEKQLHLAWPIIALGDVGEFADNCFHGRYGIYDHPHIHYCFQIDPIFTAELLLALALFEQDTPDPSTVADHEKKKVTLIEALLWCEAPEKLDQCVVVEKGESDWIWDKISDWKTLGTIIESSFPQHKGWATAARLKTEFSREKKRREIILADWESNLDSYWRLKQSGEEQSRLFQVWDNPLKLDCYAPPSVTKTR